jgi:hypothetical protein
MFNPKELLNGYLRENEDSIRSEKEDLARERVAAVIGRENLSKVTLTFSGADLEHLTMNVEGPDELKARIEEALRAGER